MPGWARRRSLGEKPRPGAPARVAPLQPGVLMIEMPAQKPDLPPPPRIKGVVGPTRDAEDDYEPGGGTWATP